VTRDRSWSLVVHDAAQAWSCIADPGPWVDLRTVAELDDDWAALGFAELAPGELSRPLDVALDDPAATGALGARLGRCLRVGDLVVLSGPLGAGKTSLTQGIAAGLGVSGPVTSPTFVLARAHRGAVPMVHADLYRLRDAEAPAQALALADLELEAALEDGVVVVEWGEGVVEELAASRLDVRLSLGGRTATNRDEGRIARVRATGPRWRVVPLP
jgi:tRNA threonylcarbamoyladenosine biosynthesis protein TsaE